MPALDSELRSQLDDVCQKARDVAVAAAESALKKRAVDVAEPFAHFGPKEKELRNRLRARGRQVGDVRNADKTQSIEQLSQELAYEFWHRMLFARFLAENNLLMHPDGVAVSLEECEELAKDAEPPAPNGFVLAARYARTMLPQIFRTDDVLLEIDFAPEQRLALEKLLASLPRQTFEADDSLGWVYQFWQTKRKDEVNAGGDKIDGRTLPAVTQLFTEHYMVEFLLHNTIGAWWCAKEGIQGTSGGAGIPPGKSPVQMPYLRWREDGTPAAGKFEGWPKALKKFTLLDPCCGSGHFLVSAFNLLVPLRMHDEGLSAREACDAVLRENLHGLELDPRCTQIAAFALALVAWKYPGENGEPLGYRELPSLNIACSGQGVTGKKEEWLKLANGDDKLRNGMERLYELFEKAPQLGSLIDPRRQNGDLFTARHAELDTLLKKALAKHTQDADLSSVGVAAQGITAAADLLARQYTLVITNVPYLGRGKQGDVVKEYIETHYAIAKADLATAFVMRCLQLCAAGGSTALVTPQNWLFLTSYKKLRERLLTDRQWNLVARLGPRAFETISGEVVNVALLGIGADEPPDDHRMAGLDVAEAKTPTDKAEQLADRVPTPVQVVKQAGQLQNPDHRVTTQQLRRGTLLSDYASSHKGISTNDDPRFIFALWETPALLDGWEYHQTSVSSNVLYDGYSNIIRYEQGVGSLRQLAASEERDRGRDKQGVNAWGKTGVAISCMRVLRASLYTGKKFNANVAVLIPKDDSHLAAIWAFCASSEFNIEVRKIDKKVSVTNATLIKVPFDLAHWQAVAAEKYPTGLPEARSDDPTQWLFKGAIATSADPLQVAVARLLGYRWPNQPKEDAVVDPFVDDDGIVCLPGVRHEAPAAERLADLLRAVGYKTEVDLAAWLRDKFFEEHCKRFHHRPFIWHIWDGRKDGFSVLVNYHKLTHKTLENLTYSYLGDWISAQSKSDKTGADLRLAAAQTLQEKLKLILAGEPPYDIFVRWKPLHEQAIGWHPDLNDGVRMNIRPFVKADILRKTPNIKWTKDRGKEPERDKHDYPWFWSGSEFVGDRLNDVHLTNEKKTAAQSRKKGAK
jgi:hypothetical protein